MSTTVLNLYTKNIEVGNMKEVFAFLRQYSYRTGHWDGSKLTCFDAVVFNIKTNSPPLHWEDEEWESIEDGLQEEFGYSQRWFHV
jgi:hypothetical protein